MQMSCWKKGASHHCQPMILRFLSCRQAPGNQTANDNDWYNHFSKRLFMACKKAQLFVISNYVMLWQKADRTRHGLLLQMTKNRLLSIDSIYFSCAIIRQKKVNQTPENSWGVFNYTCQCAHEWNLPHFAILFSTPHLRLFLSLLSCAYARRLTVIRRKAKQLMSLVDGLSSSRQEQRDVNQQEKANSLHAKCPSSL